MTKRLLVRDSMTVGVQTCSLDTPIVDIARLILEQDLEGVIVLDQEAHAAGVVTHDNLVQAYTQHDYQTLTAEDVMTDGVPQIPPDIPLAAAAQIMQDQSIRVVFLMHHAGGIVYPAAVLSYKHILRHLVAQDDEDVSDLGIKAKRQSPIDTFIQKRDAARRRALKREE